MSQAKDMMLAVKVSLFSNILLCVIKAVALVVVNSLAIAADLGISCVALAVSMILYYSIKMANRPADVLHNYGYSKVENVCELTEGAVLIGLALAMSFQAAMNLIRVEGVHSPQVGFAASLVGVVINFWGAAFIMKLARKSASPALKAEGLHFRLEGYISFAITLSFVIIIIVSRAGFPKAAQYVDPIVTLLVSGIIVVPSARLLKEAFMKLLDAAIEEAGQMDVIKALAKHMDGYCGFRNIRTRTAGRKQFIDLHLIMPAHIPLKNAHDIVSALRDDIMLTIAESEVTIRLEPCESNCAFVEEGQQCPYIGSHPR
jgi:cation diffusion facilitator family transporter